MLGIFSYKCAILGLNYEGQCLQAVFILVFFKTKHTKSKIDNEYLGLPCFPTLQNQVVSGIMLRYINRYLVMITQILQNYICKTGV